KETSFTKKANTTVIAINKPSISPGFRGIFAKILSSQCSLLVSFCLSCKLSTKSGSIKSTKNKVPIRLKEAKRPKSPRISDLRNSKLKKAKTVVKQLNTSGHDISRKEVATLLECLMCVKV